MVTARRWQGSALLAKLLFLKLDGEAALGKPLKIYIYMWTFSKIGGGVDPKVHIVLIDFLQIEKKPNYIDGLNFEKITRY